MKLQTLFRKKNISAMLRDHEPAAGEFQLYRSLGIKDLTFLGIAAIIGAGIFGTIGSAAVDGGPGVTLLFIFTAVTCLFSALCYAQFASSIPIAGSAYTYAYTSFGELVAWIIGWDLLMEYAIGNVTVAISWSDYFSSFMERIHVHIPGYFSMDYRSAGSAYHHYIIAATGTKEAFTEGYLAWIHAPRIGGFRLILDLPALAINVLITALVYIGIRESKRMNNALVFIKLSIILLVIVAGIFYIDTDNWIPFAPNGLTGIMKGVSAVFFAYIGFDAISTTAEESINPSRDLPRAMVLTLVFCTILYVLIALILTGMEHYSHLGVGDPLDYVFQKRGLSFLSGVISAGAIIAMTTVLLVFQLGQPRIWMSMSRDGLLPPAFSTIHPKFKTPSFSTIVTGITVGIPVLFFGLEEVTDLTSIGTLFAFALVCGGVLIQKREQQKPGTFKVRYINATYIAPALLIVSWIIALLFFRPQIVRLFTYENWEIFHHKIPFLLFLAAALVLTILAAVKRWSLIPLLGLMTNLYLMSQLPVISWIRFLIWLVLGLGFYFLYGYQNSRLARKLPTTGEAS